MRLLEIILARVAYVKNVRNAQCFDHLSVHCVLPLPQIDFLGVHLTAEAFFLSDTSVNSGLVKLYELTVEGGGAVSRCRARSVDMFHGIHRKLIS